MKKQFSRNEIIAGAILNDVIFGSWDIVCKQEERSEFLGEIFLPIGMGCEIPEDAMHCWARKDEALDWRLIGKHNYPMFSGCSWVMKKDWIIINKIIKEVMGDVESFMEKEEKEKTMY